MSLGCPGCCWGGERLVQALGTRHGSSCPVGPDPALLWWRGCPSCVGTKRWDPRVGVSDGKCWQLGGVSWPLEPSPAPTAPAPRGLSWHFLQPQHQHTDLLHPLPLPPHSSPVLQSLPPALHPPHQPPLYLHLQCPQNLHPNSGPCITNSHISCTPWPLSLHPPHLCPNLCTPTAPTSPAHICAHLATTPLIPTHASSTHSCGAGAASPKETPASSRDGAAQRGQAPFPPRVGPLLQSYPSSLCPSPRLFPILTSLLEVLLHLPAFETSPQLPEPAARSQPWPHVPLGVGAQWWEPRGDPVPAPSDTQAGLGPDGDMSPRARWPGAGRGCKPALSPFALPSFTAPEPSCNGSRDKVSPPQPCLSPGVGETAFSIPVTPHHPLQQHAG